MAVRPIKELLQILLDNISDMPLGLCGLVNLMSADDIITGDEHWELIGYINKNKPMNFYRFKGFFSDDGKYNFYWPVGDKIPRSKWLKKHIRKLS